MSAKRSAQMKREARELKAKTRELEAVLSPVGPGFMPKGGAAAARKHNARWEDDVAAARAAHSDPDDGRARASAIRSGAPVGVAVWAVVAASAGALFTEGALLWVLFS